jgi:hypothetical protein
VSGALAGGRRWPARLFRVPAWGTREYGVPGVASTSRRPLLRSGKRGARGQGQWHDECGRKVKTRRGETRRDGTVVVSSCSRIPLTPAAMSPAEVTEKLGLHKMRDRSWYVHPR